MASKFPPSSPTWDARKPNGVGVTDYIISGPHAKWKCKAPRSKFIKNFKM